ncbi:MAG: hypothetical protein JWO55_717 [Candidatus Saccharibacteria bacterium]|jgi:hypothetical protein|nr:hypothetical protein [Candidatus Saccharibacteria bacterium]
MTPDTNSGNTNQSKDEAPNLQQGGPAYNSLPLAMPVSRPSKKWLIIAIIFGFLTIAPVIVYEIIMAGLVKMAQDGASGTEFIAFALIPLLLLTPVFLLVDIILAIIYLVKRKPRGKKLILPIAVLAIGAVVIGLFVWSIIYNSSGQATADYYQEKTISTAEAIKRINNCEVQSVREGTGTIPPSITSADNVTWKSYESYIAKEDLATVDEAARNAPERCGNVSSSKAFSSGLLYKALTVEQATEVLGACKVIGFYYPGSNIEDDGDAARQAYDATGIVLVSDFDDAPIRIHTSPAAIEQLAPIARNAQASCPNLQFWNGRYEQRDANGNWQ